VSTAESVGASESTDIARLALVVVAHPCADSLTHAAAGAAIDGLTASGHVVETLDLYRIEFAAAMTTAERRSYSSDSPILDQMVRDHAALLERAKVLVFVYPTWWSGLPAMLKGWLERVLVTGVAFELDPLTKRVRPRLHHIERIVGISLYGSPRGYVRLINDNGRRILTRSLRLVCGRRTSTSWFALYSVDTADPEQRAAFLTRIRTSLGEIGLGGIGPR
jgi:NAD(P)H dehydrogenase (quinone)